MKIEIELSDDFIAAIKEKLQIKSDEELKSDIETAINIYYLEFYGIE